MASYIRECEIERETSYQRYEKLIQANQRIWELENKPPEYEQWELIAITLLAIGTGFALGNEVSK